MWKALVFACSLTALAQTGGTGHAGAGAAEPVGADTGKAIEDQIRSLRGLPDDQRPKVTRRLAIEIRNVPEKSYRVGLAEELANLATEGDAGRDTLQDVATTLAQALNEQPAPRNRGEVAMPYVTLATLVRYEHVDAHVTDPQFAEAMKKLEADERARAHVDFTLVDLEGKSWRLRDLAGKVVLVNFWATWCPPCRKEMPDMEALSRRFKDRGFIVLAISDEDEAKVRPFIQGKYSFPILLDPGRKVNEAMRVEGIPKSFLYDRQGKLVAQAMDGRTERQFLEMLAKVGLE
jgi:thiol-disulfide isomerase/thioredoxin